MSSQCICQGCGRCSFYTLNARMYDPKTARFLQEDTYGGTRVYSGVLKEQIANPMYYNSNASIISTKTDIETKSVYETSETGENIVYRALNQKDADRLSQGLGLEAKNPAGTWQLDEHLVGGSNKSSWMNDPYISTTTDIDVARGFSEAGSNLGVVEINLNKVTITNIQSI